MSWLVGGTGWISSLRSTAELDGEKDWDMGEPQEPGAAASRRAGSPAARGEPAGAELPAGTVTLTGPGRVGKTRLALQAAAQLAPRFADGAWLCELAPVRDAGGVDDAVAAVFSVTARAGQSIRDALVEFCAPSSCCWCSITASISSMERPGWPRPLRGRVSGW